VHVGVIGVELRTLPFFAAAADEEGKEKEKKAVAHDG
jgi:hypothetical protein